LDGPLPKWCPAVALSRQDGRHSAVALLLKAALIQVSDYRLLGASGYFLYRKLNNMDGVEQPINGYKKSHKIFCSHIFIIHNDDTYITEDYTT
jgi:hypothetical protein